MVAKVLINTSIKKLNKVYDYIIKEDMEDILVLGMRVKVSFGRGKDRFEEGIVVKILDSVETKYKLKYIEEVLDDYSYVDEKKLALAKWMSYMYFCNVYDCLKLMLPPGTNNVTNSKTLNAKTRKIVSLIKSEEDIDLDIENEILKSPKQIRVVKFLIENDNYSTLDDVVFGLEVSKDIVSRLEKNGYLAIINEEVVEDKLDLLNIKRTSKLNPTDEQKNVIDGLVKMYNDLSDNAKEDVGNNQICNKALIHGVTGSGKTEVYLQVIEEVISKGKTVILLVPEISLTYQTLVRFLSRFGNVISILHSKMTISKRKEEYRKIKKGEIKIVIGARSAIFAPIDNLGLIIMDEEHDPSYYSGSVPKYSTKEVASYIANQNNALLVLGSATPEVITYYKSKKLNKIKLFEMKNRPLNATLPEVIMVDKKQDRLLNPNSLISARLKQEIRLNLENKEQTMIFLNKRGYSSYLTCNSCGYIVKCENCDIAMTYHKKNNLCLCHYCNNVKKGFDLCPVCGSHEIKESSFGTEKIEEELYKEFKEAKILRMDRDTTIKTDSHANILNKFKDENVDILVGTQMISKGHDIENVTLVGVLGVDSMLALNDYLANEKGYSNISQVSGRAGRGGKKGRVVIETEDVLNETLNYAVTHDYESLYNKEISFREVMKYPPFTELILVSLISKDETILKSESNKIYNLLNKESNGMYKIYSPKTPFAYKINNKFKINILIKCNLNSAVLKQLHLNVNKCNSLKSKKVNLVVTRSPMVNY